MKADKEIMFKIASGKIAFPSLTIAADGEQMTIKGDSCRYFAIGYLLGLKEAGSGVTIDDCTTTEGATNE